MTGEAIRMVIVMIIAIVALALLWVLFSSYVKEGTLGMEEVVKGVKKWMCDDFLKCRVAVSPNILCKITVCSDV